MSRADGGPAFPSIAEIGDIVTTDGGMTLRDYFAAKAMQGILAQGADDHDNALHFKGQLSPVVAENAYHFADAMLAERAK